MAGMLNGLATALKGSALARTLKRLEQNRIPVRLEIEGADTTFYTLVARRSDSVVLSRPKGLAQGILKTGAWVRFSVPEAGGEVVRMQISHAHFRRPRGDDVFLCTMPADFSGRSKRKGIRYNTKRINNLHLVVPHISASCKILDISDAGCKVEAGKVNLAEELVVGESLRHTKISVGAQAHEVSLSGLTLRVSGPATAGFEMRVKEDAASHKVFGHLLRWLDKAEAGSLRIQHVADASPAMGAGV